MKNLSNTDELLRWLNDILALYVSPDIQVSYVRGDDYYRIEHTQSGRGIVCNIIDGLWCVGKPRGECLNIKYQDTNLVAPLLSEKFDSLIEGDRLNYDLLGLVYWMLTRAEEVDRTDVDDFDRFTARSSHALQYDYLDRPIIDEWFDFLRQYFVEKIPQLSVTKHKYQMFLSHDVDQPAYYHFRSFLRMSYTMVKDFLKEKNVKKFLCFPFSNYRSVASLPDDDPYNTFNWLMNVSEQNNVKSCFYFQCGLGNHFRDAHYSLSHPAIQNLMKDIHGRGHELGCHPSYMTYLFPEKIKQECSLLKERLSDLNIPSVSLGVRMHFLRWRHVETLRSLDDANFSYDTTLGYADHTGFRCGTCREYPAYNPVLQKRLRIRIRPLIVMEQTLLSPRYMKLKSAEDIIKKALSYKEICKKFDGNFTLLWHNSTLTKNQEKQIYKSIVEG